MKISFIRPNLRDTRSYDAMEPLCFAVLQGLTPDDVETTLYDERIEAIPFDEPTDLAALTVETYTAHRAYQIASTYRQRGVKVVMGGYHPSFLPDEALAFADAVVQGDAEGVWGQVVADAKAGCLRRFYRSEGFPSLRGLRFDRSVFAGKRYAPVALVQVGRGCRYNCDFCSIRAFYGSELRQRPVDEVVEEVERLGQKRILFVDDNLFVNVPQAKELFRALVPLKITWACQVSIDVARDPELMTLMRLSGCSIAVIGFESLDERNLAQMKKRWNLGGGDYSSAVRIFRDAGIMIYGTFVFGYDEDTRESFDAALEFAIRSKFYLANFNPLTPTPRAPLFDRLSREKRLIHERWWLEPGYRYGDATFHPRGMTARELAQGCYRARTSFNSHASICRRLLDTRTHLRSPYRAALFLASNLVSRREIHAKQGARLGADSALRPLVESS
jgi:radical SAM superfamily enzyme YgiQ (UPF0313 family)